MRYRCKPKITCTLEGAVFDDLGVRPKPIGSRSGEPVWYGGTGDFGYFGRIGISNRENRYVSDGYESGADR